MRKIIYLDQVIGPISIDILNEFAKTAISVELYYGQSYKTYATLSENIRTHVRNKYHRTSFIKRVISWSIFMWLTFTELLFRRKNFELFIVTNPPLNVFTGLFFKKIFNVDYHLLIFDIYPDAIVQYNYLKPGNPLIKIWKYLMKKSLKNATHVFTISNVMKKELERYSTDNQPIVIHNWVNSEMIKPIPKHKNPFAEANDLLDKKVVLYSGNFGKTHDLESILEAANLLRDDPSIHFLIIGDGEKKKTIVDLKNKYNLQNLTLLPFQDQAVFPYSVATGDIAIVSLGLGAENLSVPSKTYYMMAAGCAIIALASDSSELADIVKKHEIGCISLPGDPLKLSENISKILSSESYLQDLKEKSRETSLLYNSDNARRFVTEMGL